MKQKYWLGFAGVIALAGRWSSRDWGGLAFVQNINEAAVKMIAALLVVTLFVEKSLAAINAAVFGKKRELIETKLLNARLALAAIPSDKALTASADKAREGLADVAGDEERSRVIFWFLFALLISSAGVRTLQSLVVFPSSETVQASVGHVMDMLLTAGLLAGGSNGLNELLKLIKAGLAPNNT